MPPKRKEKKISPDKNAAHYHSSSKMNSPGIAFGGLKPGADGKIWSAKNINEAVSGGDAGFAETWVADNEQRDIEWKPSSQNKAFFVDQLPKGTKSIAAIQTIETIKRDIKRAKQVQQTEATMIKVRNKTRNQTGKRETKPKRNWELFIKLLEDKLKIIEAQQEEKTKLERLQQEARNTAQRVQKELEMKQTELKNKLVSAKQAPQRDNLQQPQHQEAESQSELEQKLSSLENELVRAKIKEAWQQLEDLEEMTRQKILHDEVRFPLEFAQATVLKNEPLREERMALEQKQMEAFRKMQQEEVAARAVLADKEKKERGKNASSGSGLKGARHLKSNR